VGGGPEAVEGGLGEARATPDDLSLLSLHILILAAREQSL
jgi:hypothetical protein